VEQAIIVPEQALTTRDGQEGVFMVGGDGDTAVWREVQTGIHQGDRVQVTGEDLHGRVVILGQQLLDDGTPVHVSPE
jgi:multidrug efflux pump subunit AcrA (membrane-fusion protein)